MSGALLLPMWDCTQSLPILVLEKKIVQAWRPRADKQLVRKLPHKKKALLRAVPIKSIVSFGVGWDWLGHVPDPTPARFCYPMCSSGTLMLVSSAYKI